MKRERKKQIPEEKEEKKMEVVVVEQVDALAAAVTAAAAAAVAEEEALWGMRLKDDDVVVVDELMTWSTVWLPSCWDVEFVEKNYEVLFDDVVWEDDLWNLNTSTQLSPLDNIRQN